MDVLAIGGGRKGQEQQGTIPQDPAYPDGVSHGGPVHRLPLDRRLGTARRGAVQEAARRVAELELRRRLHDEARAAQMGVERQDTWRYHIWISVDAGQMRKKRD